MAVAKKKKIRLGCSDFKSMVESNAYYVDKSLFIEEVIESNSDVMLAPRPRRFGKTLNLSMLRYFFDIREPENHKLFENLKIWQCDEDIKSKQGKYPVIYISFKDAKAVNWEECLGLIVSEIVQLYGEHRYVLNGDVLYENEKTKYQQILDETANTIDFKNSIKRLSEYLYRYHKQKVIILIDEYDTPIQSAYQDYYQEAVDFMRGFMSGAFKDNSNLYKAVITGILRVSKESIFSGLNNIGVFSILQKDFSDKFGFSKDEVLKILNYHNIDKSLYPTVKKWYDGYKFGENENIYNPWSILNFVTYNPMQFKPFWVNTSSNGLIKKLINDKENAPVRSEILKLLNNETLEKSIEENFVFRDLENRKHLIWTLFLFSGYLTIDKALSRKSYAIKIPNYEVKTIFQDIILTWFDVDIKVEYELLKEMANSLVSNDLTTFEKAFRKVMGDTFSYYDTTKTNEYVFHAYLLGLLAIKGDDYVLKSNRESGDGRYDIMLIPKEIKDNNGVVIEIKRVEKRGENESDEKFHNRINKELEEAKNQINKNQYYKELIQMGISEENIVKTAIVFAGKEPFVNKPEVIPFNGIKK